MIDERKSKMIDMVIEGKHTKKDIAKLLGISRQTLYQYLSDSEVSAELDKRLALIRDQSVKQFTARLEPVIEELYKIALTAQDTRSRKDACIYLCNRVLGTPTNISNITNESNKENNIDVLEAFEATLNDDDSESESAVLN